MGNARFLNSNTLSTGLESVVQDMVKVKDTQIVQSIHMSSASLNYMIDISQRDCHQLILIISHAVSTPGHSSRETLAWSWVWWRGINSHIERTLKQYSTCQVPSFYSAKHMCFSEEEGQETLIMNPYLYCRIIPEGAPQLSSKTSPISSKGSKV